MRQSALEAGADAAVVSNHWAKGGAGAKPLAEALVEVCEKEESKFKLLYDAELSIEDKINTICREIYGADGIELSELAKKQLETYTKQGYAHLPSELLNAGSRKCIALLLTISPYFLPSQSAWPKRSTLSRTIQS